MASVTKFVGTATSEAYTSSDGADWTNPTNVTSDDGNYATATSSGVRENTKWLKCTMSGNEFAIPTGSSIDGIEIEWEVKSSVNGAHEERQVQIVVGGQVTGLNRWTVRTVTSTDTVYTAGSSTDLFGIPLTVASVNASDFGCALRWERDGAAAQTVSVDYVKITVHYTEGAGDISYDSDFKVARAFVSMPVNSHDGKTFRVMLPGFGTPKAILAFAFNAIDTTGASAFPLVRQGWKSVIAAAVSSTSRMMCSNGATDGQSSIDQGHGMLADQFWNNGGSGGGRQVDSPTFGVDYIELTVDDASTATGLPAHFDALIVALGGDDFEAYLHFQGGLDGTTNEEAVISGVGFEPNVVISASGMDGDASINHNTYLGQDIGLCYNPGTGDANLIQRRIGIEHRRLDPTLTPLTDMECDGAIFTDRVHFMEDVTGEEFFWMSLKSFGSDGYTIRSAGGDGSVGDDDGCLFLALKIPRAVQVGDFTTPTSTGSQAIGDSACNPDIEFTPTFMLLGWSKLQSLDTEVVDSEDAEALGLSFITEQQQASCGFCDENAQANVDAATWIHNKAVGLLDETGTAIFEADFTQFNDGGFTANYGTVDGTARRGVFLAVGPASGGAYSLTCDAGSYALTGNDATLTADRSLTGEAGSLTLTGNAATLTADRSIAADAGSYTLTGQDATLTIDRVLAGDLGTYSLTGNDATLTYTPVGGYTLACDAGSYALTGSDATLTVDRTLVGETGSYTLTGNDAGLARGFALTSEAGALDLTGIDATMTVDRMLAGAAGSYTVTGNDATLSYSGAVFIVAWAVAGQIYTPGASKGEIYTPGALKGKVR